MPLRQRGELLPQGQVFQEEVPSGTQEPSSHGHDKGEHAAWLHSPIESHRSEGVLQLLDSAAVRSFGEAQAQVSSSEKTSSALT